jgi:hypothetical protein
LATRSNGDLVAKKHNLVGAIENLKMIRLRSVERDPGASIGGLRSTVGDRQLAIAIGGLRSVVGAELKIWGRYFNSAGLNQNFRGDCAIVVG